MSTRVRIAAVLWPPKLNVWLKIGVVFPDEVTNITQPPPLEFQGMSYVAAGLRVGQARDRCGIVRCPLKGSRDDINIHTPRGRWAMRQ